MSGGGGKVYPLNEAPVCTAEEGGLGEGEARLLPPSPPLRTTNLNSRTTPPLTAGNVDPSREWKGRASGHTELSSLSHPTLVTYPEMSPKQA